MNSIGRLEWVATRTPTTIGDFAAAGWDGPDPERLLGQHAAFVALLRSLGCDVLELPAVPGSVDACFVYDPVFVTPRGVVRFNQIKPARRDEPAALAADLAAAGLPTWAEMPAGACADGGDICWLDDTTVVIGHSYRTNRAGIAWLREVFAAEGYTVEVAQLAHDAGPSRCLHLMSVVSMVRRDLAVVYEPLAPVHLLELLAERGIARVAVGPDEYLTLGCNVLAVAPGVVVLPAGNPGVVADLRAHGVEVHTYAADEINKGEGGPTCLTRPLRRT
jgi:N-dimethylarginine dimethylaminohydrolase